MINIIVFKYEKDHGQTLQIINEIFKEQKINVQCYNTWFEFEDNKLKIEGPLDYVFLDQIFGENVVEKRVNGHQIKAQLERLELKPLFISIAPEPQTYAYHNVGPLNKLDEIRIREIREQLQLPELPHESEKLDRRVRIA